MTRTTAVRTVAHWYTDEAWYVCDDLRQIDFRDTQRADAFRRPLLNGWRAEYDAGTDQWHVRTPEGQPRTYRRM